MVREEEDNSFKLRIITGNMTGGSQDLIYWLSLEQNNLQ